MDLCLVSLFIFTLLAHIRTSQTVDLGDAYTLITRHETECELKSLSLGSELADRYNSMDEATDWDVRMHNDYLVERLGFAGWIVTGLAAKLGQTAHGLNASALAKKGGWIGQSHVNLSSYWALENQWIYMMGDSTQRQIWATFVSPFQGNNFERNAKEYTRSKCARQLPHRKNNPVSRSSNRDSFVEKAWHRQNEKNKVTCDLSGFGPSGRITFDWKIFPYVDYDEWLLGDSGMWNNDSTLRRPDILTFEIGLHTCLHSYDVKNRTFNATTVLRHESELPMFMKAVRVAIDRHNTTTGKKTVVIASTAGRGGNIDHQGGNLDNVVHQCSWRFNRIMAHEAHKQGFVVFDREEIERRLLFKSEHYIKTRNMKPILHLDMPAPNIIATALLTLISCLRKNESSHRQ
jgi:hypothetical protein